MATDPGTIDYLLDQLGTRGAAFTTRRMFGEYCLYRAGLPVALVCDDTLFVKDTPEGRARVAASMTVDFGPPYPGARPHLRLPPDAWDDGAWLRGVLDATAAALPTPKPRAPKRAADSTATPSATPIAAPNVRAAASSESAAAAKASKTTKAIKARNAPPGAKAKQPPKAKR